MRIKHGLLVAVVTITVGLVPATSTAVAPTARAAATCADYPNQAAAQEAADTRDPNGNGIYCVIYSGKRRVGRVVARNRNACQQRVISTTSGPASTPIGLPVTWTAAAVVAEPSA